MSSRTKAGFYHHLHVMFRAFGSVINPTDPMRHLNRRLGPQLFYLEGYSSREEHSYFAKLLKEQSWIKLVGEVGFNGGHSSYALLSARPDIKVVSFDLGDHSYVKTAKDFIDKEFPGRHTLILGDSLKTVPAFAQEHPQQRFDMLFVDGGHTYAMASADLKNLQPLGHERTVVVIDDLTPWNPWGQGPTQAWDEAQTKGLVRQTDLVRNGTQIPRVEGNGNDKIWATGNYVFDGNAEVT